MAPANWLGRPILDSDHAAQLELRSAALEFKDRHPRHEAEQLAYDHYVRDTSLEAAAHHLAGIKAAQGTGDMDEAQKHGALYDVHMRSLGLDPRGPVPPEVTAKRGNPDRQKLYRFKGHPADERALQGSGQVLAKFDGTWYAGLAMISKAERMTCDWTPTPSTGERCKNPRSRKVGERQLCHHHADLAAKEDHRQDQTRLTTPSKLLEKDEASAPPWSERTSHPDRVEIPKLGSRDRRRWDASFMGVVQQHYGKVSAPFKVDLARTVPGNRVANESRADLYKRMARKERVLPPILVERRGDSWHVLDGNHRVEAAKRAGLKQLDAVERVHSTVKKSEEPVATITERLQIVGQAARQLIALKKAEAADAVSKKMHDDAVDYLKKSGVDPSLCKCAPPGWSDSDMGKLKSKVGGDSAYAIAWAQHHKSRDPKRS